MKIMVDRKKQYHYNRIISEHGQIKRVMKWTLG